MITVIEDGTKKTFYTKCGSCASELEYSLEDVNEEKIGQFSPMAHRYITCPVCGQKIDAYLWTKAEQERYPPTIPFYPVGTCGLQTEVADTNE